MQTDNSTENLVTSDVTETEVVKTRKPRSPNKPRTVEKQGLLASKKVDRINAKREKALEKAAERVNARFDLQITEFIAALPAEVQPLVTGVNKPQIEDEAAA